MRTETNRIEYKQQLHDDLEKEAVAFLNYNEGGILYIGVDKHGNVVDILDIDGDMLKIKDRLKNNVLPSCMGLFDVATEKMDGKDVIKITFASGPEKPYYTKKHGMSEKGCYMRVGTAAEPMPTKLIEDLFSRRTRNSIGKIKSYQQKLTFEQLKIYYEAKGTLLNDKFAANLELLTDQNDYNYVAYLMSDTNNISIKVAKYRGIGRIDLIESNEYGYSCLIKATKQVLDKIDLENNTFVKITPKEREEKRRWNPIALREAIINSLVHNDYSNEVPPKFEIFDDRMEITSAGGLPEGLSQTEFFEGYSVPRNKEMMRIYKDLELVEHLGSGVPRILETYGQECFKFSDNFIRMIFPSSIVLGEQNEYIDIRDLEQVTEQVGKNTEQVGNTQQGDIQIDEKSTEQVTEQVGENTEQVTEQVAKLLMALGVEYYSTKKMIELLGLKHRPTLFYDYLQPALNLELIEMTIPDKPNSRLQKYRLTPLGIKLKKQLEIKLPRMYE